MWHCHACAPEGWSDDEWRERIDGGRLVDVIGVWETVVLEYCLVEDGRFAERDVGAEDVEVFCLGFGG